MTGFYKQAEEMGYSPEATYAMLQQLNKVAEAAHTYVEEAANASGDPVLFKKALVQELLEKNAEGDLNSAVQGFLANHPQIQGFLANHPNIQKMLTTMQQGGAGGGVLGGLGGGALGLIMSLMTGSNPLTGMLAGGGLGAGAGYFGKDMYNAFQNHTPIQRQPLARHLPWFLPPLEQMQQNRLLSPTPQKWWVVVRLPPLQNFQMLARQQEKCFLVSLTSPNRRVQVCRPR